MTHNNTKGLVRAFDARTGKLLWTFNTIPRPGEFGNDTWENDSWAVNGNTGVWTQITVDEDLGLVYLPVETPTSDYYGGHRPGNNLFAESLVCVDLKTGQRKWHYQVVHHPLWDFDISSAADSRRHHRQRQRDQGGRAADQAGVSLRVRSRHRPAGVADRGAPGAAVRRARREIRPTQPFPTKPPAYARNGVAIDDLIDFTPEMRAEATRSVARYRWDRGCTTRQCSAAPTVRSRRDRHGQRGRRDQLARRRLRSRNPHRFREREQRRDHVRVARAAAAGLLGHSLRVGAGGQPFTEVLGPGDCCAADCRARRAAAAQRPAARRPLLLPRRPRRPPTGGGRGRGGGLLVRGWCRSVKPPYGTLSAINLDRGEIVWQVPHGDTPDNVRNHPALKGLNIPKTSGTAASACW